MKKLVSSILDDSPKYTFVYGLSLAFYGWVVLHGMRPGESFWNALMRAGRLWIVFALFFVIFGMVAAYQALVKMRRNRSSEKEVRQ